VFKTLQEPRAVVLTHWIVAVTASSPAFVSADASDI